MCEHKFFLIYELGLQDDPNQKAEKGNIVHKALEVLALAKLAQQNNKNTFEDENFGTLKSDIPEKIAFELAYKHYVEMSKFEYVEKDKKECWKWLTKTLEYDNGKLDPRKRNIIAAEPHFDFEIKKDWAKIGDEYLRLKGTIDLVVNDGVLEIVDWKTGKRKNWATGQEKTYEKLISDPQLNIYYYAACQLYGPQDMIVTIFYMNDGGDFSMVFHQKDLPQIENLIKNRFEKIKRTLVPKPNIAWTCRFCKFDKEKWPDSDLNVCQYMHNEVKEKGLGKTIELYQIKENMGYAGGGRKSDSDTVKKGESGDG